MRDLKTHTIRRKTMLVSAMVIAAGAPFVFAQGDLGAFKIDMVEAHSSSNTAPLSAQYPDLSLNHIVVLREVGSVEGAHQPMGFQLIVGDQSPQSNGFVHTAYEYATDSSRSQAGAFGLDAIRKDELNVVPLPPAALAGLGLLTGIAGIRYLRRRK